MRLNEMVGGTNIFDTPQTGYIYEDEIPACVKIVNNRVKCNNLNNCTIDTCYFKPTGKPIIRQMIEINRGIANLGRKYKGK